jgi:hypothetical protein
MGKATVDVSSAKSAADAAAMILGKDFVKVPLQPSNDESKNTKKKAVNVRNGIIWEIHGLYTYFKTD